MAFTGIMTTEAEIDQKTGANVSASYTDTMKTAAVLQAESMVNCIARVNYSDTYSSLNADVKGLLNDIVSSFVAIQAISYDMSGYTSRIEAEDMINVLRDGMLRGLSILRDQKVVTFINGA
jgi:hypothetical protein